MPPLVQWQRYIVFLVAKEISALVGVSYIIKKVFESTFRNRFRLSCLSTIFIRIPGLCFYLKCLMSYINGFVSTSSTNQWKAFFQFRISFRINGWKPKNIQMNSEVNIDQSAMCYTSMDLSWEALQTNGFFLFSNLEFCLFVWTTILKRAAGLYFYVKCLMLCINGFVLTTSTNKWKAFFQISNSFSNFWP